MESQETGNPIQPNPLDSTPVPETSNPEANLPPVSNQAQKQPKALPGSTADVSAGTETTKATSTENKPLPDKRPSGLLWTKNEDSIYNNLRDVYIWLRDIHNANSQRQIFYSDIEWAHENIHPVFKLIDQLLEDKRSLEHKKNELEKDKTDWQRGYNALKTETDSLRNFRQNYQTEYNKQHQEIARLKQQQESAKAKTDELEGSRARLLAEISSLKRNTGTHYEGTSDRPQHHVLTGEYKTLKEQNLDPLANSLFNCMVALTPELKPERKQKVNDIKAAISDAVLICGQKIMLGESITLAELPSGILDDLQSLLCEKLQLTNPNLPPETAELLQKAATIAQGKLPYPPAGKWQESDFHQAYTELSDRLDQTLNLGISSLPEELKMEIQTAISKSLIFLQRAALADPPATLSLDTKAAPFRPEYHEAAKGYEDEGKILKAIYPVYLVNGTPKVKAVVLTEPLVLPTSDSLPQNTPTNSALTTPSPSNSLSSEIEKQKIRLEAKRETLIKNVKLKWMNTSESSYQTSNNELLEKLSKIESLDIIRELENEFHKVDNLLQFTEKLQIS